MKKSSYAKYTEALAPKSPLLKDCIMAFLVGGFICVIGQGLLDLYGGPLGLSEKDAGTLCSVTLVFIAALLTGIGVFDDIARRAGAGTLVPITGFANAVVSPAIEFKSEGYITGVASKMFIIAGPVIVYGIIASVVYGLILYLKGRFGI